MVVKLDEIKQRLPGNVRLLYRDFKSAFKYCVYTAALSRRNFPKIKFYSNRETVDMILEHGLSLARFGDGEFGWLLGRDAAEGYQDLSSDLSNRLSEVLHSSEPNLMIGVLKVLNDDSEMGFRARAHWREFKAKSQDQIMRELDLDRVYADSSITRPYIDLRNRSAASYEFENIKRLWEGKRILLVEGSESRLGVGNDLFASSKEVERILAPSRNAYSHYGEILRAVLKYAHCYDLTLLALGPTATILAYDLCRKGIQAIDIGHIDNEYEWMLKGSKRKEAIPGKTVDEVGSAATRTIYDEGYLSSILESVAIEVE